MIAAGVMLVLMETLADFGAVSIFNYDTFTTTIYKAWFSMFSLSTAAKFSSFLVLLVFILVMAEQAVRQRRRYTTAERQPAPTVRTILTGKRCYAASAYCGLILLFAFIIPVIQLLRGASADWGQHFDARYLGFLSRSLLLSALATLLVTASALLLVYAERSAHSFKPNLLVRFATLGYALPGTILAVGGMILVTFIDHQLKNRLGLTTVITGTLLAMMLGYLSRFMILAYNPIDSAMHRVTPHMGEAARSLGATPFMILSKIQMPLVRGGIFAGSLLVFVDVMKEMPITLMTRPFGWDTLAVRIFQFTSEGEWNHAALPALTLVILGFIPVILLTRQPVFKG